MIDKKVMEAFNTRTGMNFLLGASTMIFYYGGRFAGYYKRHLEYESGHVGKDAAKEYQTG